jgi:hypothetical protein
MSEQTTRHRGNSTRLLSSIRAVGALASAGRRRMAAAAGVLLTLSTRKATPTLISLVALLVSVVSFYVSSLKPAHVSMSVGDSMQIWHDLDQRLEIDLPIVFRNSGSEAGVLRSLAIILRDPRSEESLFISWYGTKSTSGATWVYDTVLTPITVPAGGELSKMVNFSGAQSNVDWLPKPTTYDLYVLAWSGARETASEILESTWTFKQSDIASIKQYREQGKKTGIWIYKDSRFAADARMLTKGEFNQLTKGASQN